MEEYRSSTAIAKGKDGKATADKAGVRFDAVKIIKIAIDRCNNYQPGCTICAQVTYVDF